MRQHWLWGRGLRPGIASCFVFPDWRGSVRPLLGNRLVFIATCSQWLSCLWNFVCVIIVPVLMALLLGFCSVRFFFLFFHLVLISRPFSSLLDKIITLSCWTFSENYSNGPKLGLRNARIRLMNMTERETRLYVWFTPGAKLMRLYVCPYVTVSVSLFMPQYLWWQCVYIFVYMHVDI